MTMINKAYCWILNRCADPIEMQTFLKLYTNNGMQMPSIVRTLITSSEFYSKFVANYTTGPVDVLYNRFLGRAADPSTLFINSDDKKRKIMFMSTNFSNLFFDNRKKTSNT